MQLKHSLAVSLGVCTILFLGGCPKEAQPAPDSASAAGPPATNAQPEPLTDSGGAAPDAVPISVNVYPQPATNPTRLDYEINVHPMATSISKLLIFFEVRDPSTGTTFDRVDPEDVLAIAPGFIEVNFPANSPRHVFSVDLKADRTIPAHVTITAVNKVSGKGAAGTTQNPVAKP